MSWQSYVDNNMIGTGKIVKGAIFGQDKSTWAISADFPVAVNEIDALLAAFKDPSGIRASGLHLAGQKYIALQCDNRSVYAKLGSGGVVCVKTNQAILVGVYNQSAQPGEATKVVEGLADYLISVGY
ncbi:profilin, required for normal timing of actin polymerization in response to thermal stress [Allomyces javanicus]|nr:profilin, required for normal timing of actin polymerization in response to thermal stress [Allomyces javanicus]KAJ3366813.1 profilin, required for normal timing of actin polymerization in response to thermal stress [Allomyces javanicus]